ncbi:transposase [Ilumatobacter sp.]|uniref:transposase n=1 Tax=Ilumatobacter sp. TaxID=1967498 RepID=UPI003B523260
MNRGVDRSTIFHGDADRVEFGRLLGIASDRFTIEVHAYCLMDNHFHLLVRCPESGLSDFVQLLTSTFARFVNRRTDRVGHLFGSRFTSRLLTTSQ